MSRLPTVIASLRVLITGSAKTKSFNLKGEKYRAVFDPEQEEWSLYKGTDTDPYLEGSVYDDGSIDEDDVPPALLPKLLAFIKTEMERYKNRPTTKEKTISFRGDKYRVVLNLQTNDWTIYKNTETEPFGVGMTSGGSLDTDSDTLSKMPRALQDKVETVLQFLTGDPNTEYD